MTGGDELSGPGMYRNQAGELRYWTGQRWDPREAATIWTRVWCFIIDMVLFSLILFAVLFGVGFLIGTLNPGQESAPRGLGWLLTAAIFLLYFSISYASAGRTLGMALAEQREKWSV